MTVPPAAEIRSAILAALDAAAGKSVSPADIAIAIAGKDETKWRLLMKPIRREGERLAAEGALVFLRKGKVSQPAETRGIYRMAGADQGPGNS